MAFIMIPYRYRYKDYPNNARATVLSKMICNPVLLCILGLLALACVNGMLMSVLDDSLRASMTDEARSWADRICGAIGLALIVLLEIKRMAITEKLAGSLIRKQTRKLNEITAPGRPNGVGYYVYFLPEERNVSQIFVSKDYRAESPASAKGVFVLYYATEGEKTCTRLSFVDKASGKVLYDRPVLNGRMRWSNPLFAQKFRADEEKVGTLIRALISRH